MPFRKEYAARPRRRRSRSRLPLRRRRLGTRAEQAAPDKIVEHRPPSLGTLAAHGLDGEPSARTPMTTSREIAVALRSSRTLNAIPTLWS